MTGTDPRDPLGYYQALGVTPDASAADIVRGYREQARRWHPDTNPTGGSHERMVRINRAYEILSDPAGRAAYDQAARMTAGQASGAATGGTQRPGQPPRPEPNTTYVDFGTLDPGARRQRTVSVTNRGGPYRTVRVEPEQTSFARLLRIQTPDDAARPIRIVFEARLPAGQHTPRRQQATVRIYLDDTYTEVQLLATATVPEPAPPPPPPTGGNSTSSSGSDDQPPPRADASSRRSFAALFTTIGVALLGWLFASAILTDDEAWERADATDTAATSDADRSTGHERAPEPSEPSDGRGSDSDGDPPPEPASPDGSDSGTTSAPSDPADSDADDPDAAAGRHEIVAELDLRTVWAVEAGHGAVWAASGGRDGAIHKIDPATNEVEAEVPVDFPGSFAIGPDSVWVPHEAPGVLPGYGQERLLRIDPATATVTGDITLDTFGAHVAVGAGSVWVSGGRDPRGVVRIDPDSLQVLATIPTDAPPGALVFADGALWVANGQNVTVTRIDPATNTVTDTIDLDVGQRGCCTNAKNVVSGAGAIWVAVTDDPDSGHVVRIDPATRTQTATIRIGRASQDFGGTMIAASDSAVWVANAFDATVSRIDPDTNRVTAVVATDRVDDRGVIIGDRPHTVAIADDTVWVGSNVLMRLAPL